MSACMNYWADWGLVLGLRGVFEGRLFTRWVPWYHGAYRKPVIDFQI